MRPLCLRMTAFGPYVEEQVIDFAALAGRTLAPAVPAQAPSPFPVIQEPFLQRHVLAQDLAIGHL